jgi:two-component system OmpR family response regulator
VTDRGLAVKHWAGPPVPALGLPSNQRAVTVFVPTTVHPAGALSGHWAPDPPVVWIDPSAPTCDVMQVHVVQHRRMSRRTTGEGGGRKRQCRDRRGPHATEGGSPARCGDLQTLHAGSVQKERRACEFPEKLPGCSQQVPSFGRYLVHMALTAPTDDLAQARVLVVDDEDSITDLISTVLRYEGFEVRTAESGRTAVKVARDFAPDLVVLDVMLPDLDGFEVYRRLADRPDRLPVLFLTARDTTEDRVHGLTLGADDYMGKPFSLEELVARVRAVLRRTRGAKPNQTLLRFSDLELDEDAREVRRGGRRIDLTPTEFNLLHYLLANSGRVVSKAQILDHVWRYDFGGDASVVETYISYLRKKIDSGAQTTPLIQTVRGFGYAIREPRA